MPIRHIDFVNGERKTVEKLNIHEKKAYSDVFMPRPLRVTDRYKTPLICMKPGQSIPPHPSGAGVFYIVSGRAVMTVDGVDVDVVPGDMIFIDKGEVRGIRAVEELLAFAVAMI